MKVIECMRAKGASVDPDLPYPALIVRAVRYFPKCVDAAFKAWRPRFTGCLGA